MRTARVENRDRARRTNARHRCVSWGAALMLLAVAAPAAAQRSTSDRDLQNRPNSSGLSTEDRRRFEELKADDARNEAADRDLRQKLLRLPALPDERNTLLGSWRVEAGAGGLLGLDQGKGAGGTDAYFRDLWKALESNPDKLLCVPMFGKGITFASSTYSISALDGSTFGGSVDYRSTQKQVILAITSNWKILPFQIAGPDRILFGESCALVRAGTAGASAAKVTPAPGTARAGATASAPPATGALPQVAAVAPAPPPSTLSRPSPEVCRNTLLDKLGVVGSNQVRAMSDVRFKEAAIEGKVPNTNNLRIDLRGSACDDPRIKATLYDFDANEMLQSITYLWDRPPGPAPAPIFTERVSALARFHPTLPQPQTPGRLQGDISLGRLILQDMPERNLLLEAYAAKK